MLELGTGTPLALGSSLALFLALACYPLLLQSCRGAGEFIRAGVDARDVPAYGSHLPLTFLFCSALPCCVTLSVIHLIGLQHSYRRSGAWFTNSNNFVEYRQKSVKLARFEFCNLIKFHQIRSTYNQEIVRQFLPHRTCEQSCP
jgi:hypothetical protein